MPSVSGRVGNLGRDRPGSLGSAPVPVGRPRSWRPGPRLVMVTLAVLVALAGVTVGGYLYLNHVVAGIARVPVMFDVSHAKTPTAPR